MHCRNSMFFIVSWHNRIVDSGSFAFISGYLSIMCSDAVERHDDKSLMEHFHSQPWSRPAVDPAQSQLCFLIFLRVYRVFSDATHPPRCLAQPSHQHAPKLCPSSCPLQLLPLHHEPIHNPKQYLPAQTQRLDPRKTLHVHCLTLAP